MPLIRKESELERSATATADGIELRAARKAAGLTLARLADHLGCTASYLSIIETGGIGARRREPYRPSAAVVDVIKRGIRELSGGQSDD